MSSALRPTPYLEDQVSVFMSPWDGVAPGPLFFAFNDSQGYGGGILTRLQTGQVFFRLRLYFFGLTTL
jgi:hypothetical protein